MPTNLIYNIPHRPLIESRCRKSESLRFGGLLFKKKNFCWSPRHIKLYKRSEKIFFCFYHRYLGTLCLLPTGVMTATRFPHIWRKLKKFKPNVFAKTSTSGTPRLSPYMDVIMLKGSAKHFSSYIFIYQRVICIPFCKINYYQ